MPPGAPGDRGRSSANNGHIASTKPSPHLLTNHEFYHKNLKEMSTVSRNIKMIRLFKVALTTSFLILIEMFSRSSDNVHVLCKTANHVLITIQCQFTNVFNYENTNLPLRLVIVFVASTDVAAIPPNAKVQSSTTLVPGFKTTLIPALTIATSSSRRCACLYP